MTHTRTALVIGGGIAGPAAAMALQQAGIQATVYEAHPSGAEGIGIFLTLASNGIDALRVLGADKPALAAGFPTPRIMLRSGTGKRLGEARTGLSLPDGTTSHTIKRADLYRALHERGRRPRHRDRARQAPGRSRADRRWGAGGVRRRHRGHRRRADRRRRRPLHGPPAHRPGRARPDLRRPGQPRRLCPRRAGGRRTGQLHHDLRQAGVLRLRHGPRRRGVVVRERAPPRRARPRRGRGHHRRAMATPAGRAVRRGRRARGPAGGGQRPRRHRCASPIHAIPHLPTWHTGRMVVIGDAAHAPSPTSGQGASLAIEDAVVLAKCLRDLPTRSGVRPFRGDCAAPGWSASSRWPPASTTTRPPGPSPGWSGTRCCRSS